MSKSAQIVATSLMTSPPTALTTISSEAPRSSGLYAWWAPASVLPEFDGPAHRLATETRLLYIGLATNLRQRLKGHHVRRSGTSTLRRTLAGLLLGELALRTHRTDRVVLIDEDEVRLTAWIVNHLQVSWCLHPTPRDVEADVIHALIPPLNIDHSLSPALAAVKAAREHYRRSAE